MEKRRLGWTELELTSVGLGTWAIGGPGLKFSWGPQDDRESVRTIRHALELGINWIDTAAVYGLGHSETVVGQALRGLDEKPIVATKCCRVSDGAGGATFRFDRASVRAEAEASLKRLGVERIDLYQIHHPGEGDSFLEAWETIADLVREGKVRYGGVSNFSREQVERALKIHPVASLQPPYSLLRRDIESGLLEFCGANRIGVVAYSPMQKGILTDKFTRDWVAGLPADDHRRNDPRFQGLALEVNLDFVARLREIAAAGNLTIGQLAIAWVLRRTEVTAAIVGARHPYQIEETVQASGRALTPREIEAVGRLLSEFESDERLKV
ncbi:MAG TPA: aldo/keto reductase [bacterium]|nr:aldo/keto reductase [bacterium]HNS49260.1 aldo/keto reductase [bacterium]